MTRAVIIGGSGHVGTYLVPRLVHAGYQVINVSRRQRAPYQPHGAWQQVEQVTIDRTAAESAGTFGDQIAALQPDVVIDMICFTLESAQQLVEALHGKVQHFLHCGTIWIHGPSVEVPTTEMTPRRPFGDYGTRKTAIEAYLLDEARRNGFPSTQLHPGHIVGPGWAPLNPEGHFNPRVFSDLAQGLEITLPNLGMETVHHVHADDVAQSFMQALANRSQAIGESFHVVSPAALTLRGYAEAVAGWFGKRANIRYLPWEEWRAGQPADQAQATWDHIAHSPNCSIAKAQRLLHYQPRYSSLQAVYEAVQWLIMQDTVATE
ncbi:MAG TPA: NAD-dependent epimerase/dehydratase family protein [Caldilineaceae bacterium]|nr:NAD-dependent epimerase/dehydratase family protein [Caldilineaceae bacterium]